MRLTVVMFGITVLDLSVGPNEVAGDDVADVLTTGFGFTPSPPDQRWLDCPDLGG